MEIWKPIIGYKQYEISNYGKVRTIADEATRKERFLKPLEHPRGYYRVALWLNNKSKFILIHRIVAEYFVSNPDNKETVNHIDGDKINNHYLNLEWNTYRENMNHAVDNKISAGGERNGRAKLTNEQANEIRSNTILNQYELAVKYNISQSTINRIKQNKGWKI